MTVYLERKQPFEPVYGVDLNRIVEALTNQRGANIPMIASYAICFGYQPVDSVFKARFRFWVTPNVDTVIKVYLSFTLQPFHVGNQTTAQTTTTASTTAAATPHFHTWVAHAGTVSASIGPDAGGSIVSGSGAPAGFSTATETPGDGSSHFSVSGGIDSAGSGHTHNIPALTVNSATLNPPTAIYEAGMAQGVHVFVDGVDRTIALGGPFGSGVAADISALDCTSFIQATGWHEFQLSSTALGGITAQIQYQSLINSTT